MSYEILRGKDLNRDLEARLRAAMGDAEPEIRFWGELAKLAGIHVQTLRTLGEHTHLRNFLRLAEVLGCDLIDLLPPGRRQRPRGGERSGARLALGAQAFEDAKEIERNEADTWGKDPAPLTMSEIRRGTRFNGSRLEKAIAAREVLAGRLTVEAVTPEETP